jgi:hypothetical protein
MRDRGDAMLQTDGAGAPRGLTRSRLLRAALGGGAIVAGDAVMGIRHGEAPLAAPSRDLDAKILNFYLTLEYVQEAFYGAAVDAGRLEGELLKLASAVREQEARHVEFLTKRLSGDADPAPKTNFPEDLAAPERFLDAAVDLEEAVLGGYIGQSANLTAPTMRDVATLVSVEARQVAWLRDLARVSPAPNAADPARKPDNVLGFLRDRGYLA